MLPTNFIPKYSNSDTRGLDTQTQIKDYQNTPKNNQTVCSETQLYPKFTPQVRVAEISTDRTWQKVILRLNLKPNTWTGKRHIDKKMTAMYQLDNITSHN